MSCNFYLFHALSLNHIPVTRWAYCTAVHGTALALCTSEMTNNGSRNGQSWTRLEAYLASLHPGDVITVNDTIKNTDLAPETVHIVLAALTKANLFERSGDRFTRRSAISL